MTPGRRLLLLLASCTLMYSGMASALGMGDITLHSALNQPLSAEIELLEVGSLSPEDIRVVLASSSDFANVGVERLAFLQDLSFIPVIDGNRSRIRVVSSKPVREPYLNFLVEITRAQSRMLREYTVLLDPAPDTADASQGVTASIPQAFASPMPVSSEPARVELPAELPLAAQGKRHRVRGGDSLWTIAGLYSSSASQPEFMRDVLALNPNAFAGGDPARLQADVSLLLPDTAEATPAVDRAAGSEMEATATRPVTDAVPADSALLNDQLESLRVQLFEELEASREENQQLRQMLGQMQQQLESVTAQLVDQGQSQPVVSPPVEQSTPVVESAASPTVEPAAQVAVAEPATSFRWQHWTLPGVGVLVALLLGGLWFSRRKPADPLPEAGYMVVESPLPVPPLASGAVAVEMPRQPAHASVSETDVLEAADIYITYGRRDEAIDVLQRGIERSPEQLDLRLRYLGLLAESGDVEGYSAAADSYLYAGGSQAYLDQLLALHPALASAFVPAEPPPPMGDPDVSFVLNEVAEMELHAHAEAEASVSRPIVDTDQDFSLDSQAWLDDFDEVLPLDGMPAALLDDTENFGSMPSAEDLRQLEPNPEHLVRLDQAVVYIEQGDIESACVILESLATEGDEWQRRQVSDLLAKIA